MPTVARRPRAARPRRRPGATIVEFAIVAPLLFALLLGIVECGGCSWSPRCR